MGQAVQVPLYRSTGLQKVTKYKYAILLNRRMAVIIKGIIINDRDNQVVNDGQ